MRFAAVLLLLFFTSISIYGISGVAIDTNEDGETDRWEELDGEGNTIFQFDRDYDGTIDYLVKINEFGNKMIEELDYNYDGVMDDFYFYADGVLKKREVDTNFDTRIDLWVYLKEGIYIEKYTRDTDFDGEIDLIRSFGS